MDLNGDGLPDLVRRRGTQIEVRYNLGHALGAWEPAGALDPALANAPIDAFQSFEDSTAMFGKTFDSTSNALAHETTLTQYKTTNVICCSRSSPRPRAPTPRGRPGSSSI
jgi:hypothetical protein